MGCAGVVWFRVDGLRLAGQGTAQLRPHQASPAEPP
jgi:hypothetical protein